MIDPSRKQCLEICPNLTGKSSGGFRNRVALRSQTTAEPPSSTVIRVLWAGVSVIMIIVGLWFHPSSATWTCYLKLPSLPPHLHMGYYK